MWGKTAIGCFLFWDAAKRKLLNTYRRFGKTYRSHLQGYSGPTKVSILLRLYFPEQRRSHLFVAEFRSQRATISLYIYMYNTITEMSCVYCAVRTESLGTVQVNRGVWRVDESAGYLSLSTLTVVFLICFVSSNRLINIPLKSIDSSCCTV
jgi:hypothetical protein